MQAKDTCIRMGSGKAVQLGTSCNKVRVIKSRGWAGHVAQIEEGRSTLTC